MKEGKMKKEYGKGKVKEEMSVLHTLLNELY